MKRVFYVYEIKLRGTDRCYIGQTANLGDRLMTHLSELRRGSKKSIWMEDFKKYGVTSFDFSIIATANTREEAKRIESEQILERMAIYNYDKRVTSKAIEGINFI